MMRRRSVTVLVLLAVVAAGATGCTPRISSPAPTAVSPEPERSTAPATPDRGADATSPECVDGVLALTDSTPRVRFDGTCQRVEIAGTGLDVDLERATVEVLVVRGDANDVDAGTLAELLVEGQRNEVDADAIASATVRGDGNDIDVDGELGALTVNGNGNEVDARALGSVVVDGQDNDVDVDD